ncbi:glycoside hydrolase family 78 protein [Diplodia corticola]|uniref:Glycoside hydrolase family 78 protein n=1 Tax=Diplodia corticola TaxID=236234 RepID=A0A1J9R188_9PEZI|nr:glycoside hydrolase family 78 protein [Diplodia corticola]OJD34018.1 glycoside hydrolase family 78 protein [Diplodia corticola]
MPFSIVKATWAFSCLLTSHTVLAQSCWRDTVCDGPTKAAFPGPWDANIYAPSSRTIQPSSILSLANASVISSYPGTATLQGNASALVFDFGQEVGGIVHLSYNATGAGTLGLAFSEAKNWIGLRSDSSNGLFEAGDGAIYDGPFDSAATSPRSYVMPDEKLRGGFRYLTLFLLTNSSSTSPARIDVGSINLEISFQPTWANLRAYRGYFHSSDELLNRIWYAGAYTLQTNAVPVRTGRAWPALSAGWANNGTLANGSTVIVDGAKRDRAVWPGDMGVAVPAAYVSTGELESVRNALEVMFDYQEADGAIPEAGPPLLQKGSDTYHMWTMIGTYNYVLYSGDLDFLDLVWERYLKAMDYVYAKVDSSGLLNVTGTRDWARWQQGWNNTEANMILYHTLTTAATLASWHANTTTTDPTPLTATFLTRASRLRTAINTHAWDPSASLYRDNATQTTTLHPQDANALSLYFSVAPTNDTTTATSISTALTNNWTPLGPEPPELPGNISPFITSFELRAHVAARRPDRALALIRRTWGWYANHPDATGGSTVVEGFRVDGSFGYRAERGYGADASYVSHAHGWSAGPTAVLTEGVVGLGVVGLAGRRWRVRPAWGDLGWARAGFTTGLGRFEAGWMRGAEADAGSGVGEGEATVVWWCAPEGTEGEVLVEGLGEVRGVTVEVDGEELVGGVEVGAGGSVRVEVVATGGNYTMVVR